MRDINATDHLQVTHVGSDVFFLDIIGQSTVVVLVDLHLMDVVEFHESEERLLQAPKSHDDDVDLTRGLTDRRRYDKFYCGSEFWVLVEQLWTATKPCILRWVRVLGSC